MTGHFLQSIASCATNCGSASIANKSTRPLGMQKSGWETPFQTSDVPAAIQSAQTCNRKTSKKHERNAVPERSIDYKQKDGTHLPCAGNLLGQILQRACACVLNFSGTSSFGRLKLKSIPSESACALVCFIVCGSKEMLHHQKLHLDGRRGPLSGQSHR